MVICPPTHNPRTLFFHHTKNRVRRCCVGGDMAILIVAFFQKLGLVDKALIQNFYYLESFQSKILAKNLEEESGKSS